MADLLMKSTILFLLSFGVGSIALHAVAAIPLTASKPRLEWALFHTPTARIQPPAEVAAVIFPEDPPDMPRLARRPKPIPATVPLPRSRPEALDPPSTIIIRAVASAAMPTIRQVATAAAVARAPEPPSVKPSPPSATQVSAPPLPRPPPDWRPGSDRLRHAMLEALEHLHETDALLFGADLRAFAKMMNAYAEMRWQARGLEISQRASVLDQRIVERTGELARAGRITPNQFPSRAGSFIEAASHTVPPLAPMTDNLAGEPKPFRWW